MTGKTALIVGSGNDVGQAISIKMAECGAQVVLLDSDRKSLDELAAKVEAAGLKPEIVTLDPMDSNAVKGAVDAVLKKFNTIDILVNNIDHKDGVALSEGTLDTWTKSLNNNVIPVVSFCLNVIPFMKENKYGRIVNVGSLEYLGSSDHANYSTAKSAIFGLTRSLALDLAKDGITVNQVIAGDIKSSENEMSEDVEGKVAAQTPVQRLGQPGDIAYAVAFLARDSCGYVTGQNLIVCGGKSIYSSMSV